MNLTRSLALGIAGIVVSTKVVGQDLPRFIEERIGAYESAPLSDSPGEIWRYEYEGKPVFYLPLSRLCCDISSELYDSDGNLICRPDGGFSGSGDGKCPDFVALRLDGIRVWIDPRRADDLGDSEDDTRG